MNSLSPHLIPPMNKFWRKVDKVRRNSMSCYYIFLIGVKKVCPNIGCKQDIFIWQSWNVYSFISSKLFIVTLKDKVIHLWFDIHISNPRLEQIYQHEYLHSVFYNMLLWSYTTSYTNSSNHENKQVYIHMSIYNIPNQHQNKFTK